MHMAHAKYTFGSVYEELNQEGRREDTFNLENNIFITHI